MSSISLSDSEQIAINTAVEAGAKKYFAQRRERVTPFVQQHLSLPGAMRMHRLAFGGDLLRAPANLMWAAPYVGLRLSSALLRKVGAKGLGARLGAVSPGFQTRVQREVEWLVHTELMELPLEQDGRAFQQNALMAAILAQSSLSELMLEYLEPIRQQAGNPNFDASLRQHLERYGGTRLAAADLASGVMALAGGVTFFKQLTPGALSTGTALAAAIAQQSAINSFFLGPSLGSLYYGLFPAAASTGLVAASTAGVLAALGVLSAFSGVITDPIQSRLGIHHRRLHKLIDSLEQSFFDADTSGFRPRDHYVARIFDLFDMLKSAAALA